MQNESVRSRISRRASEVFYTDAQAAPRMTLRGGNAEDSYDLVPAPDPDLDKLTDAYLEAYTFWGLAYLDPASWRHYLPYMIDYTFRHMDDPKYEASCETHRNWTFFRDKYWVSRSQLLSPGNGSESRVHGECNLGLVEFVDGLPVRHALLTGGRTLIYSLPPFSDDE